MHYKNLLGVLKASVHMQTSKSSWYNFNFQECQHVSHLRISRTFVMIRVKMCSEVNSLLKVRKQRVEINGQF